MNRAKRDFDEFFSDVQSDLSGDLKELKGSSLYRGNAHWRQLDGGERSEVIERLIRWMADKRHKVTFGAVSKASLDSLRSEYNLDGFQDTSSWGIAAMHVVLTVQKAHQREKKNKGNTLFVFDAATKRDELTQMVIDPPEATGGFYARKKRQQHLDQVIDVPYFVDSKHVGLVQVADLFAYLIRLYAQLKEGKIEEKFDGEVARLDRWISDAQPCLLPDAARWSSRSKDPCTKFLRAAAPQSLLKITS